MVVHTSFPWWTLSATNNGLNMLNYQNYLTNCFAVTQCWTSMAGFVASISHLSSSIHKNTRHRTINHKYITTRHKTSYIPKVVVLFILYDDWLISGVIITGQNVAKTWDANMTIICNSRNWTLIQSLTNISVQPRDIPRHTQAYI